MFINNCINLTSAKFTQVSPTGGTWIVVAKWITWRPVHQSLASWNRQLIEFECCSLESPLIFSSLLTCHFFGCLSSISPHRGIHFQQIADHYRIWHLHRRHEPLRPEPTARRGGEITGRLSWLQLDFQSGNQPRRLHRIHGTGFHRWKVRLITLHGK